VHLAHYSVGGIDIRDNYGNTLLHLASKRGRLEVVKYLVSEGAKIDINNNFRETPYYFASKNEHLQIVEYFLSRNGRH